MPDQIIDTVMALDVQANATKAKVLFGWMQGDTRNKIAFLRLRTVAHLACAFLNEG